MQRRYKSFFNWCPPLCLYHCEYSFICQEHPSPAKVGGHQDAVQKPRSQVLFVIRICRTWRYHGCHTWTWRRRPGVDASANDAAASVNTATVLLDCLRPATHPAVRSLVPTEERPHHDPTMRLSWPLSAAGNLSVLSTDWISSSPLSIYVYLPVCSSPWEHPLSSCGGMGQHSTGVNQ